MKKGTYFIKIIHSLFLFHFSFFIFGFFIFVCYFLYLIYFNYRCFSSRVVRDNAVALKIIPAQLSERDYKQLISEKYTNSQEIGVFWKNGEISL